MATLRYEISLQVLKASEIYLNTRREISYLKVAMYCSIISFLYKHQWNTKPLIHFTVRPGQGTFQDFINEFVIQKLNLLVIAVMSIKFKSSFVLGQIEITLNGQNCFQDIYIYI